MFCGNLLVDLSAEANAVEQRDRTDDAEAAIDQRPQKWNASNRAADERQHKHARACAQTDIKYPHISFRREERTNEEHDNDEMTECQPIGRVAEKWKT